MPDSFSYEEAAGVTPAAAAPPQAATAPRVIPPARSGSASAPYIYAGHDAYLPAPQAAAYDALDKAGALDRAAQPGSQKFPLAQMQDGAVPAAGSWYIPYGGGAPVQSQGDSSFSYEDAAKGQVGPDTRPTSQGLGFWKGLNQAPENVATWLAKVPGVNAIDDIAARMAGFNSMTDAVGQRKQEIANAEQTQKPGLAGQIGGGIIGTLPLLAVPGGVLTQGAAGGALMTDHPNDALRVGADALTGAAGGQLLHWGGKAALDTVAPKITDAAQRLLKAGVPLTTDMMTGGKGPWGWAGKIASTLPGAGELYRARGNEALAAAGPGFANDAMSAINPAIGPAENGSALFTAAKAAKDAAYAGVGDGASVPLDGAYAARMQPVRQAVGELPADLQGRYGRVVGREVVGRVDPTTGELSTGALADAKAGINKDIAKFPSPSGWDADYVDALKATRRSLVDALGDTSPTAKAQLQAADQAYPGYLIVRDAVRRANMNSTTMDQFPTPQQMLSAVRENAAPDAFAAGTAPGQGFAQAAKDVLPRKFKDVSSPMQSLIEGGIGAGVIGTDVLGQHLGGNAAGLALALPQIGMMPLYTKTAQDFLRGALSRSAAIRQAIERSTGPIERYLAAPSAAAGGVLPRMAAPLVFGPQSPAYAQ